MPDLAAQGGHTNTVELLLEILKLWVQAGMHHCILPHRVAILLQQSHFSTEVPRWKLEKTPLHLASRSGHTRMVELLLGKGALIESSDIYKCTLLDYVVEYGHTDRASILVAAHAAHGYHAL